MAIKMETSSSPMAPLLLRNLLASIFIHAYNSLFFLSGKCRLLKALRWFLASAFLFFLRLLPSLFPSLSSPFESQNSAINSITKDETFSPSTGIANSTAAVCGDSGVSRALSQLLLIMNDIPVSSRKYEMVRSLAENLIDENVSEGSRTLREVNCAVLLMAFARTMSQLEAAVPEQGRKRVGDEASGAHEGHHRHYSFYSTARRLVKGMKYCGQAAWRYATLRDELSRSGSSAEKLAAELLWLAQKMADSGCADEAVCKWASASKLAWLALSAEPRLQGSLVKVSTFLFKQAKEMRKDTPTNSEHQRIRRTKMKMVLLWLPLLCGANNGTDAPILNMGERAEMERVLEDIISTLEGEEQERVLSLWLHHFTYCSVSDWPNLRACYIRWFRDSRAQLLLDTRVPSVIDQSSPLGEFIYGICPYVVAT